MCTAKNGCATRTVSAVGNWEIGVVGECTDPSRLRAGAVSVLLQGGAGVEVR